MAAGGVLIAFKDVLVTSYRDDLFKSEFTSYSLNTLMIYFLLVLIPQILIIAFLSFCFFERFFIVI